MAEIEIDGVSVAFRSANQADGRIALTKTDLTIEKGDFVCVLGPSGCGKSTLMNVIGGLLPATSGQVRVDGEVVTHPGPDRGMVFQHYSLFQWLTVRENMEFGPSVKGWTVGRRKEAVDRLLEIVGLVDHADEYPKALSGGMRQRVAIARALVMEPKVLLMDEPFGALDAQTRSRMQEMLLEVWTRTKTTVVFITHDVEEAVYLANRVLVMSPHPGEIVADLRIDLPRPRSLDVIAGDAFNAYRRDVLLTLRH